MATACPLIELPVCGTNNITYANDCLAQAAGATVACEGTCPCEGKNKAVAVGQRLDHRQRLACASIQSTLSLEPPNSRATSHQASVPLLCRR